MTYSKQLHNSKTSSNSTVMIYILLKYPTTFFSLLVVIGHPLKILLFPLKVKKKLKSLKLLVTVQEYDCHTS